MWQYILTTISAVMLFEFMILGCIKYGLLDCYSAYAAKWHQFYDKLNIWSVVTFISAFLMIPVLLENSKRSPVQFLGFFAPVSLFWVALSPRYAKEKSQWWMHQIGAWGAVIFIVTYIFLIPKLLWPVGIICGASVFSILSKKECWMFWGEIAAYLCAYVTMYVMIGVNSGVL